MDKLWNCANAFNSLLNIKYHFILGRRQKLIDLSICFHSIDFHHLMGLGKLKDLRISSQNRKQVFQDILAKKITDEIISKSQYYPQIENRFLPLSCIETILDDNHLVFKYNKKELVFSSIEADFLLSTPCLGNDVYIFIQKNQHFETYYCRSFFPKEQKDYTKGQTNYTILLKEKINLKTGEQEIQLDRISHKHS